MWFEIYIEGRWRWRLCEQFSWGTEIIATSHQSHLDARSCEVEI